LLAHIGEVEARGVHRERSCAMGAGARMSTPAGSAAAKPGCSSSIISMHMQVAGYRPRRTSRSAAAHTTRSPPKPTSVGSTFARNAAFPTRASAANPTRKPVLGAGDPQTRASAAARRIDNVEEESLTRAALALSPPKKIGRAHLRETRRFRPAPARGFRPAPARQRGGFDRRQRGDSDRGALTLRCRARR
jgi:hypothetical protein